MNPGSKIHAFTFPEALVTIALGLVFATLVGGLYFQGRLLADSQDRRDKLVQEKLALATYLPALCEDVRPPEWAQAEQVFHENTDGLEAKYWNADPKQTLAFQVDNGTLRVKAGGATWLWTALRPLSVEFWKASGRVVGLEVQWTEGAARRTAYLPWGRRPL